jgi:hypothetical protein
VRVLGLPFEFVEVAEQLAETRTFIDRINPPEIIAETLDVLGAQQSHGDYSLLVARHSDDLLTNSLRPVT